MRPSAHQLDLSRQVERMQFPIDTGQSNRWDETQVCISNNNDKRACRVSPQFRWTSGCGRTLQRPSRVRPRERKGCARWQASKSTNGSTLFLLRLQAMQQASAGVGWSSEHEYYGKAIASWGAESKLRWEALRPRFEYDLCRKRRCVLPADLLSDGARAVRTRDKLPPKVAPAHPRAISCATSAVVVRRPLSWCIIFTGSLVGKNDLTRET